MTQSSLPPNPFVAAGMIEDSRLFVGRQDELQAMVSRMTGAQPTSINIYGEKRIGKSSLLYHFFLTWEQRVQNPNRYVVIYLSLRDVNCQTEISFYQAVTQGLSSSVSGWQNWLNNALKRKSLNRQEFSETIRQCEQQGKLPVICLDDFESLLKYPQEFDNGFYDNLRSLMDDNSLMLVIASRKKLNVYGTEHRFISSFFNLGHTLKLKELTTDEAIKLVRLSNGLTNGVPVLSIDEQNYAQQWGKRHPCHLQLAGYYLVEARQSGKSVKWAKEQFEKQIANLNANSKRQRWRWVRWVWNSLSQIGAFGLWLADIWNNAKTAVLGIVFLVVIVLIILNPQEISEFFKYLLNLVK